MADAETIFATAENEFPINMGNIEQALLSFAIPGMYGTVGIKIRLMPTAADEVQLEILRTRITGRDSTKEEQHVIASNERYNLVRQKLAMHAREFTVKSEIREVVGTFHDGKLQTLQIVKGSLTI